MSNNLFREKYSWGYSEKGFFWSAAGVKHSSDKVSTMPATKLSLNHIGAQNSCCTISRVFRKYLKKGEILVEAAGVEPASENVTGQKPTCVVAFLPQALPWDFRGRPS